MDLRDAYFALAVWVGKEHGHKESLDLENEHTILTLAFGKLFGNDMGVVAEEGQASISGTIRAVVPIFLFCSANVLVDVLLFRMAFDLGEQNPTRSYSLYKAKHEQG